MAQTMVVPLRLVLIERDGINLPGTEVGEVLEEDLEIVIDLVIEIGMMITTDLREVVILIDNPRLLPVAEMAVIGAGTVEDLAIAGDHVVAMIEVIVLEIKIDQDLVIVKEKVV